MNSKISVANLVMLAGAVVTLLFSFFGFFKFGDESFSAWDSDAFAFVTAVPAILALAMIVWIACEMFGVALPQDLLTFNPAQVKATWGIAAAGLMIAFVATGGQGLDKSAFFWLQLLGSFAMAAGAVMALLGKGTETVNLPSTSPTSSGSAPEQAAQVPPPPPQPQQQPPQQQPPPPGSGTPPPPPNA